MFLRRAFELLNCATVGLIGYYLWGNHTFNQFLLSSNQSLFSGVLIYVITMVFIFLTMHSITIWAYKQIKIRRKNEELEFKKQFLLLDQLEKQTRHGLVDDPYTKALQTLVVTEALTPKATRKHKTLKKSNSADSQLLQNGTSNKSSFKKMWSSLRKVNEPVDANMAQVGAPTPIKLKPAPPPPPSANRTPVAIHQSQRKVKSDKTNSEVTKNIVNINIQKRIEELNKRKMYGGYENPALAIEEKQLKLKSKPFR